MAQHEKLSEYSFKNQSSNESFICINLLKIDTDAKFHTINLVVYGSLLFLEFQNYETHFHTNAGNWILMIAFQHKFNAQHKIKLRKYAKVLNC